MTQLGLLLALLALVGCTSTSDKADGGSPRITESSARAIPAE